VLIKNQLKAKRAVAKIEGTFFIVSYHAKHKKSHVNVMAGKVWVKNPHTAKGFVVVHPGYYTLILWGKPPRKPIKLNYGQWKKYHRLTGPRVYKFYGNKFKIKYGGKHKPFKKGAKYKRQKHWSKTKGGYKIKPKGAYKKPVKGKKGGGKKKKGGKK